MEMDHSHTSPSSPMTMAMVFTTTHNTPLFSTQWTPSSTASYAGTCIFLVILSILSRCLVASKTHLEQRWRNTHLKRRYVVVAGKPSEAARVESHPDAKTAMLVTSQGIEESVRVVHRDTYETPPWRFSVDLPRAVVYVVIVGVSYLLMLAVMTMNVGYFASVLGGSFLGELLVGRFVHWDEAHGH
ncbi:copper transporter family protein [Aspergillus mulundensis]|uniref:Copper transport protein n=1 Tax=Aspergillus mulundensis TaxID=1810919 RepID=A0A3D8REU7_9EURO|nr:putative Copper transporter family protein [Aspergillus mulundensis]RDW72579.1 putative Copper transporter family protein [Aspergillus mulundensis]